VDLASFWELVKSALGLDGPDVAETVARAIRLLVVTLLTVWIAHLVSDRIWRTARGGAAYAEIGALLSRAAALAIYGVGLSIVLAILGVSWMAIAAILGAATFGVSLALQDVGRSFVNGIYILIERPFRIGDRVRIGGTEGRVQEVGLRLTTLRTEAGDRISVPNTVVFASVIENASVGRFDRHKYVIEGIERTIPEIDVTVTQALLGTPYLSERKPIVEVIAATPDGTAIEVTVEHELGQRVDDVVIDRLRAAFPNAAVSAKSGGATS
jgi:small-conductance mechanosensitive channel